MAKITLVGAGSVVFAKNLICDILQYPALSDSILCLMDIDPERLATIEKLARRVVAQLGVKARIEATLDLREACRGAKFVITTIQVGGYKPSTVADFEIPAKYGLRQTIADTLGVGGVFRALRSIPELAKVARTVQEVGAPDPLLLNYTNPMAMNMWGVDRLTGIASVGLCHSVQGTSGQIAGYCGLDAKDVSYLVAGINHMAFFLKFEYKGKDAYPLLFRALENPDTFACDRVRFEMMRRLGYFVTESSEHQSEYNPYFIHHGDEVIERFGIPINEYIRRCEAQIASWGDLERDLLDESKPVEIHRSVEYGSTIINSIVEGKPSVVYGNVPNTGLIENLPRGCSVEVPCLVDKQGIQPTYIGKLPPQLAAIIRTNVNVQELTVEAAVTRRRDYIYQAVMADPHTAATLPLDKIWAMCDELIEAHQKDGVLGEFEPVARNTGKPLSAVSRVFLSAEPEDVPFLGGSREARFRLVAKNEMLRAFQGSIVLEVEGAELAGSGQIDLQIPAGETVAVPFVLQRPDGADGALTVAIRSASPDTMETDFHMPKRQQVTLPASDAKAPAVELDWSGNAVARGRVWMEGADLALELRVNDTDVKTGKDISWWKASAVEIGLKDAVLPTAQTAMIVVIPDVEAPQILHNGKPSQSGTAKICRDPSGYALSLRIPLAQVGLQPGNPFLFEVVCHVNALGTAHGNTRAAWQGSNEPRLDQSRYALVIPE
ncbi:MAG: alpha-glucosidase/alpha-galactosidase [Chthoniobacteraceae bacterium]|nr:alpha-glucosidase/alpha-galactosidase [Chthoniobacteraceae bacterium]